MQFLVIPTCKAPMDKRNSCKLVFYPFAIHAMFSQSEHESSARYLSIAHSHESFWERISSSKQGECERLEGNTRSLSAPWLVKPRSAAKGRKGGLVPISPQPPRSDVPSAPMLPLYGLILSRLRRRYCWREIKREGIKPGGDGTPLVLMIVKVVRPRAGRAWLAG